MYPNIFRECKIGKLSLKNRLSVPPMGSLQATPDGFVTPLDISYYAARAKGGYGMIIVEMTIIDPSGNADQNLIWIDNDDKLPGLTQLAAAINENGARSFIQIAHAGRQTSSALTGMTPIAPSAIPCPVNRELPHELTTAECYAYIDKFIECAERAKRAGFDGIELHAAHGYLLGEFLSVRTNKRIDEFGGCAENRMRMVVECIKGIKARCGADYPVIVRMNSFDRREYGAGVNDALLYAQTFEAAGADALDISNGVYGALDHIVPSQEYASGYNLEVPAMLKKIVKIPIIATGRFTDPAFIESALSLGRADIIATGRQSIADPYFPNKIKEGRLAEVTPCTGCSQRCLGAPVNERDVGKTCMYNPFGNERPDFAITPAKERKKIVVVGAGPGGLAGAWIAAQRGHSVVLFEKEKEVGGQFVLAAIPPYKQELARVIQHYKYMCIKNGVELRLGTEVTAELLEKERADAVILATGGVPLIPKEIDESKVILAKDVLAGGKIPAGPVLVIGGGLVGIETAEFLLDYFTSVTIVEMLPEIMTGMSPTTSLPLGAKLANSHSVTIMTDTKVLSVSDGAAQIEKDGVRREIGPFSAIVLAVGAKAYDPLGDAARATGAQVFVIGDAAGARTAKEAVFEAACAALDI